MPDDYEYLDDEIPPSNLEDVCDRLDRIEEAIRANHWEPTALIWGVLIFIVIAIWTPDLWHSRVRYAWSYGVSSDQVTTEKRPTDCDFFTAPIGEKGCKYKRQVNSIQVRTDYSDAASPVHYVSYDDGKTWSVDNSLPATQPQVVVSWKRIED